MILLSQTMQVRAQFYTRVRSIGKAAEENSKTTMGSKDSLPKQNDFLVPSIFVKLMESCLGMDSELQLIFMFNFFNKTDSDVNCDVMKELMWVPSVNSDAVSEDARLAAWMAPGVMSLENKLTSSQYN